MNATGEKEGTIVTYLRFFYIIVVTAFILSLMNILEMSFYSASDAGRILISTKQLAAGTFIFPVEIVRLDIGETEPLSVYTNFCFNALLTYILYAAGILIAVIFGRRKRFGKIINCITLCLAGLCFIGAGINLIFFKEGVLPQLTDEVLKYLFQAGNLEVRTLQIANISGGISIFAGIGFILGIFPCLKQYKEIKNDND